MNDNTTEFVQALRDLADFYEASPELPAPYYNVMMVPTNSTDDLAQALRRGGTKRFFGKRFEIHKHFGDEKYGIELIFSANREQVCNAEVVGKRTVLKPDYDNVPKVEVEEDVVEWDCGPILKKAWESND